MARSNVRKFGNWVNEDNVPYTVYSDKARKTRGKTSINPNDPQENPDSFQPVDSPPRSPTRSKPRTQLEEPIMKGVAKPSPEHKVNKEGVDVRHEYSPSQNQQAVNEPSYAPAHTQRPARSARPNTSFDQSFDRSPLHPQQQGKGARRTSGPPAWEGKINEGSHGNHSTPGRSRPKSAYYLGDESPDKGTTVPQFGAWNDSDPQSAENFTGIFNKVREERNAGPGNVSSTPKHPSYVIKNQPNQRKKCGCFGW